MQRGYALFRGRVPVSWLLFFFYLIVWGGLIIACFPNLWPRFIHEHVDGHIKLQQDFVRKVEVMRQAHSSVRLTGSLIVRLTEAFNNAVFIQRVQVKEAPHATLKFTLRSGEQVFVAQGLKEDDIYILRYKQGKRVACYWARETQLYTFLARQMWRSGGFMRKARQDRLRSTHLRLVR